MGIIFSIILIIVGIGFIFTVFYIVKKIREASKILFGTSDIIEGIKNQEEHYRETPKTVSGMTRIELPRIEEDFPEFNWHQWKQICETTIKNYLEAIENKNTSYLNNSSSELKNQASLDIENAIQQGIKEVFNNINIHQTEITGYEKNSGICKIDIQTSLEYVHSLWGEEVKCPIENKLEQHRYSLQLVYIQDISLVSDLENSFGVSCSNCGAPITRLGDKLCEYCGMGVEPINIKAWTLHKIEKKI